MTLLEITLLLKVSDRHWLTVGWQVCAKPLTQCTLIDGLEVTMVISYIVAFCWLYAIQPLVDDLQSTRADNWNVDSLYNVHPAPLPRRPRPLSVSRRSRSRSRSRSPSRVRGRRRWRRSKSSTLSDRLFVVRQFYLRVICVVRWTVIQGKTYEIKLVIFKICVTLLQIGHAFVVNQINSNTYVGSTIQWSLYTIRYKSLTWTEKLSVGLVNVAHVTRNKNIKKNKLKQTNASAHCPLSPVPVQDLWRQSKWNHWTNDYGDGESFERGSLRTWGWQTIILRNRDPMGRKLGSE